MVILVDYQTTVQEGFTGVIYQEFRSEVGTPEREEQWKVHKKKGK